MKVEEKEIEQVMLTRSDERVKRRFLVSIWHYRGMVLCTLKFAGTISHFYCFAVFREDVSVPFVLYHHSYSI